MRFIVMVVLALSALGAPLAGQGPPPTEIYLAPLAMEGGLPVVGTPVNITRSPGYDNQPWFTPDGRGILFTSARDGQMDIYRYDLAAKTISRLTSTPESEYSATMMPGGKRFSVIRVESDNTQRLWSFALDGSDPRLVLESLKPVGYHAWIDDSNLALFVLGSPNALVHADAHSGKADTLARDIGRSLATLPGRRGFSYTHRVDSTMVLASMQWPGAASRDLIALPRGAQDIVWLSSDVVVTSLDSKLLSWRVGTSSWTAVGDLSAELGSVSRLAVSPDGKWLAIVAMPKP